MGVVLGLAGMTGCPGGDDGTDESDGSAGAQSPRPDSFAFRASFGRCFRYTPSAPSFPRTSSTVGTAESSRST